MNHLKTIAHICIKSSNLGRTLDFYCGGLGLVRQFNFTRQGRVIGFYLQLAERSFIEVFETDEAVPTAANAGLHHFCLETDHMEAVRRRFVEQGFEPGEIRKGQTKACNSGSRTRAGWRSSSTSTRHGARSSTRRTATWRWIGEGGETPESIGVTEFAYDSASRERPDSAILVVWAINHQKQRRNPTRKRTRNPTRPRPQSQRLRRPKWCRRPGKK